MKIPKVKAIRYGKPTSIVIYRFRGVDGAVPMSAVTFDSSGAMYATASKGGVKGDGTIFKLTPSGSGYAFTRLHSFSGSDGANPEASLMLMNGTLYGTTFAGGPKGLGTVFSISTSGTQFKRIYAFAGGADGANPMSTLLWNAGALFGTTFRGGVGKKCGPGCGTVFAVKPSGKENVVYAFLGREDGARPMAGLSAGSGGTLFGTTVTGGLGISPPTNCVFIEQLRGCGTVFALVRGSSGYSKQTIYRFQTEFDGTFPTGGLFIKPSGNIYGTTRYCCGGYQGGAVFSLTAASSGYKESILYDLGFNALGDAATGLLASTHKIFYGTTVQGTLGFGNIYSVSANAGVLLYAFRGAKDGANPYGGVTAYSGALYGTTQYGGGCKRMSTGCGTIFRISPTFTDSQPK